MSSVIGLPNKCLSKGDAYTTATMWYIYKRLACLSRSVGSFYKEAMTTETKTEKQKKTSFHSPNKLPIWFLIRFGDWERSCAAKTKDTFPPVMKKTNRNNNSSERYEQSYFYEINIDWAKTKKNASWVHTAELVIKIIKAFFISYSYAASGILMKKSHSLACLINSVMRHSGWLLGNVFVNNYQKNIS